MSAAAFPSWAILEPFVFRRDDDASFPDESKAPVRASGTTSLGAPFRIAFSFAEPPRVSRLYAQLPGFPGPDKLTPLAFLATHHRLALLQVCTLLPNFVIVQDFFIFSAYHDPSSLQRLPPSSEMDAQPPPGHLDYLVERRLLRDRHIGLLCRGEGEQEFVVAELHLSKIRNKVHADIFFLKSAVPARCGEKWSSVRVPILHSGDPGDLLFWQTEGVVPVDHWLCWIDYSRGMLFCDLFGKPKPTVSFLSDGIGHGALKPGASFTITCHTLRLDGSMALLKNKGMLGRMRWIEDSTATSDKLWPASAHRESPDEFPHDIVIFPQVNIDRPHVVHFLTSSYEPLKKMWLVAIDMNTATVESSSQYINGKEDLATVDSDLTTLRSTCPMPLLTCELSKYLNPPRKRKDVE
ncbi:uncharacterized protein LOC120650720 isoform X3 [Panicum virgatum]|nr:uncharacterized protein LOC120650720 isoform X3 [Panicum virgatum]